MATYEPRVGDVVQLSSGGAPFTVVGWDNRTCVLLAVSSGGMAQDVRVTPESITLYDGPLTPALPEASKE